MVRRTSEAPARAAVVTPPAVRPQAYAGAAGAAGHDGQGRGRACSGLGCEGAQAQGDAEVQPEHEGRVQRDVHAIGGHRDQQRRPGVLQSAQDASPGQHDQHRRRPEQADAQVGDRLQAHRRRAAESADDLRGERPAGREHQDADCGGEPEPVDAVPDRGLAAAGAELPGDGGRGAVGEEDGHAHERGQGLAGDAKAAQRHRSEPSHNGGVCEQEQRLGDKRPEGGNGERRISASFGLRARARSGRGPPSSRAAR